MSSPAPHLHIHRRRSLAGPVVLIAIGVIFLLGNMHYLSWASLHHYFARYWPALLILWGLVKLLEHWQDTRAGMPSRGIGAGGVVLIVFLILFGMGFTASDHINWNGLRGQMDMDDDFSGLFGNSYNFSATMDQPFAAGSDLKVVSDRGDVVVNTWSEPKIKVVVRKKVVADDEEKGKKIDGETQPTFTTAGATVTLNANTGSAGNNAVASDLEIYLPQKANLEVSTRRGDIRIAGRTGNIITNSHGDVTVADNTGNVNITLRRGNVRATNIKGEVSVDGRADDTNISDVSGEVRFSGDFFGQMNLAKLAKGVTFHSSRTDMQMARLDGDLTMESGDLRAHAIIGPMHVITRAKDIHIEDVSGNLKINNSNGVVEYRAGKVLGEVEINNQHGTVQVMLPKNAAFQVDARTNRGDIETDFPSIQVRSEHNSQIASGNVGSGGPQVKLTNDRGDVQIRQSTGAAAPVPPQPPKAPSAPGLQRGAVIDRGHWAVYRGRRGVVVREPRRYAPGTL
jgi:putative adhesin/cell wall-active antibiotic response 4TMS protein YvqF